MTDDNFRLVTMAQLIAQNNWLSHETDDYIQAARVVTDQILAPVEAKRNAAQARIDAALAELDRCAIEGYWSGTLVERIRTELLGTAQTAEEEQ